MISRALAAIRRLVPWPRREYACRCGFNSFGMPKSSLDVATIFVLAECPRCAWPARLRLTIRRARGPR